MKLTPGRAAVLRDAIVRAAQGVEKRVKDRQRDADIRGERFALTWEDMVATVTEIIGRAPDQCI